MTTNRRQHWVPRAYLCGFADTDEGLRVFARLPDKRGVREFITTIEGVANERDLYSAKSDEGRDNSLDDAIRTLLEDKLPQTFAPVITGRELSYDELLAVVQLAGAQDMRRPSAVHNLTDALSKIMDHAGSRWAARFFGLASELRVMTALPISQNRPKESPPGR